MKALSNSVVLMLQISLFTLSLPCWAIQVVPFPMSSFPLILPHSHTRLHTTYTKLLHDSLSIFTGLITEI